MNRYSEKCGSVIRIPGDTKGLMAKYKRLTAAIWKYWQQFYGLQASGTKVKA